MTHHRSALRAFGQLWWCTVWKRSVKECLDHLHGKHGGALFLDMKTLGKFFHPWTVSREFRSAPLQPGVSGVVADVRLFRLVHR